MNGKKGNDKYMNKVNTKLIRGGVVITTTTREEERLLFRLFSSKESLEKEVQC